MLTSVKKLIKSADQFPFRPSEALVFNKEAII